jgi:predicted PurR-regulated permease PerM
MTLSGPDVPPTTTELTATRVLYRAAIFAIAMVALALLLLQLKFVIIQIFAAVIVAAGMAPLVARATDPARAHLFGWRPPKAVVVVIIYVVVGFVLVVLASVMISIALDGVNNLVNRAPTYAATIESWLATVQPRRHCSRICTLSTFSAGPAAFHKPSPGCSIRCSARRPCC